MEILSRFRKATPTRTAPRAPAGRSAASMGKRPSVGSDGADRDARLPTTKPAGTRRIMRVAPGPDGKVGSVAPAPATPVKFVVATEANVADLKARELEFVTGVDPDADVRLTDEQAACVALTRDGILMVSQSQLRENFVQSALKRIQKARHPVRVKLLVTLDTISELTSGAGLEIGKSRTAGSVEPMQALALELFGIAANESASDMHFHVRKKHAQIRMRVQGDLKHVKEMPSAEAHDLLQAIFNMADQSDSTYNVMQGQDARLVGTGDYSLPQGVAGVRLRFNPCGQGERHLVARFLAEQRASKMQDVDILGYTPHHLRDLKAIRERPNGLVVVSGPTGSGKSTTLQLCLTALINVPGPKPNVMTVEDPVEYEIPGAVQIPVTNAKTPEERRQAFQEAISGMLRSDPEICMIGEIRDNQSGMLAFTAAQTGHATWTTLHTNDAISITTRLEDIGIEAYKVYDPDNLIGLIGQRLVRKVCPECSFTWERRHFADVPDDLEATLVRLLGDRVTQVRFANHDGCPACDHSGTSGRTVAAEVVRPDHVMMEALGRRDKPGGRKHWMDELGGCTMVEHALHLVAEGSVDPMEACRKVAPLSDVSPERVSVVFERFETRSDGVSRPDVPSLRDRMASSGPGESRDHDPDVQEDDR